MSSPLHVSQIGSFGKTSTCAAYIVFQLNTHRKAMSSEDDGEDDGAAHLPSHDGLLDNVSEGVLEKVLISQHFVGIILLPIVGNTCEREAAGSSDAGQACPFTAVTIGPTTQTALLVVMTVIVVVGLSVIVDEQSN